MNIEDLVEKYKLIPQELKTMKRWVCFRVEQLKDTPNKTTKRPYNAITGKLAKVNDNLTWSTFKLAINGCVKYGMDGIGFVLGDGIFGIDLDNHMDENGEFDYPQEEFKSLCDEFINALDSYTEYSQSGNGIHIICEGKLPEGKRRKRGVETYDSGRFFAFTGNTIRNIPIQNREEEIKPLWEKYVKDAEPTFKNDFIDTYKNNNNYVELTLDDEEIIEAALSSAQGGAFYNYYKCGDLSQNENDHSKADLAFCNMLAFWTNKDPMKMDRIFRKSALMRDKWDEKRGTNTYGEITIQEAINSTPKGFIKYEKKQEKDESYLNEQQQIDENGEVVNLMNLDEKGEPIFRVKYSFKDYPYTDTGNAQRLYDYFGDLFHFNTTDGVWLFWTGKVWIDDGKESPILRKYATKLIELIQQESKELLDQMFELRSNGQVDKAKQVENQFKECNKNVARVSNKAGKDAMISEFKGVGRIALPSSAFNRDEFLLNTQDGIVDLKTGEIHPFDKNKLMTYITKCGVSYEEPKEWIKFLNSVFFRKDKPEETKQIIDTLQSCIGYSLTGSVSEQTMFILYGDGANGKSTLTEFVAEALGSYADNVRSSILMDQKTTDSSVSYSLAKIQGTRFLQTGETKMGSFFAESQLKSITGGDSISARYAFGREFTYKPRFKIWLSTNYRPNIAGTDRGIWRRMLLIPFLNTFEGENKDKHLPEKLRKEMAQFLGWAIQGELTRQKNDGLIIPKCLTNEVQMWREDCDVVEKFISENCVKAKEEKVLQKTLYSNYVVWCKETGNYQYGSTAFNRQINKKGFGSNRVNGKTCFLGINLQRDATTSYDLTEV